MIKALLSVLNVLEGEEKPVLLLLGYGFFMGVFLAAYKVVSTTLFLDNMSEYIREAFFVSGVLGVITTWLYAALQDRVHYSRLIFFNILNIIVFIIISKIIYDYNHDKWLIFTMFVMLGPITSLLILGFWGIFGRMFDLRQSKRIIGGIDSGQLVAIIITTFSIPFIVPYITDITNIMLIGLAGLFISLLFFFKISTQFELSSYHKKHVEIRKETKFTNMFRNKYILYMSLFLFLSMTAFVFVDYSFMNVSEQQYPNEKHLASFLGVFEGSIMILSLLIQTFVNEKLLNMYGIKTSLLLLPTILLLFTAAAIFSGTYYGYDVASPNFIWFFLFIALSRLFTSTIRDATENPVYKLFFMPLDSRVRFDIQTKIEGTINEFSRALAGGIILSLGFLPFFKLIHYSYILILIIIAWVYITIKLYNLYKVNIQLKLEKQRQEAEKIEQKGKSLLLSTLESSIKSNNENLMIFSLRVMSKIAPETFKKEIAKIKNDRSINIHDSALRILERDFSFIHIANMDSPGRMEIGDKEDDKQPKLQQKYLLSLKNSSDKEERKLAAELIGATKFEGGINILNDLLNDIDSEVVKVAMKAASELKSMELLPFIIDNLQKKNYEDVAVEALINYGELAFSPLEVVFYNTEKSINVRSRIVYIYGKVGGEEARNLLWKKIDFPDKQVVSQAFLSLYHTEFTAADDDVNKIKYELEIDISNFVWNLKAIEQLNKIEDHGLDMIIGALEEENDYYKAHIYMLLSMIYDQKTIQLVKENIESDDSEDNSYALELLDVFLSEDLKHKIIPIYEDISDFDRIRRLEIFYPYIDIDDDELIRQVINRDFNRINRWTKACTIHYIGNNKIADSYNMELIANLFNPDTLLSEISAWALHEINERDFEKYLLRIDPEEQMHLKNLMVGKKYDGMSELRPHTKFELTRFLKSNSILSDLPSHILTAIVDNMEEVYLEDKILPESQEWDRNSFYVVFHGLLEVKSEDGALLDQFSEGSFIGEQINIDLSQENISFVVIGDTVLLKIPKNKFLDLITNEYDVTLKLLESIGVERELQ